MSDDDTLAASWADSSSDPNITNDCFDVNFTPSHFAHKPLWQIRLECITVITVTLITIFGNITNILILRSLPSWGTYTGNFLINLAITDLGVGVFLMSFAIYPASVNSGYWPYGTFMCRFSGYLGAVFCSTSITSLTLISIDRYIAVTQALRYYTLMTDSRCYTLIVSSWIVSIICYLPLFMDDIVGVKYYPNSFLCAANFGEHLYYIIAVIMIFMLPCSAIMTFTYSQLLLLSFRHSKQIQTQERATTKGGQIRKNRKAIKTLLIITGCYNIAWLPFTSLSFYRAFHHNDEDACKEETLPHWVEFFLPWLAMSNSFSNSIVYFAFNKEYRGQARKLFRLGRTHNNNTVIDLIEMEGHL